MNITGAMRKIINLAYRDRDLVQFQSSLIIDLVKSLRKISSDFGSDECDGNCIEAKIALDRLDKKIDDFLSNN